jgi:HD superfamily phosphodiesterase
MRLPLGELFSFVLVISKRHNIDESHSLGHSMRVFQFAEKIAREEVKYVQNPEIFAKQHSVIQAAAILHDTCDKKYRNEEDGLKDIEKLLLPLMPPDKVNATLRIIDTMSYSKVKKNGMPDLGGYQTAYNVVREADLLDAYDFDRSMIYHMQRNNHSIDAAYENAHDLFENRVLRHEADGLLMTQYAKNQHAKLSQNAIRRMQSWKRVLSVKK